ncbi:MAG: hypothetical protein M3Y87_15425, partial [Myxococcota bacterium]|nr:hypothetical protein [Myxococcota bacterium]
MIAVDDRDERNAHRRPRVLIAGAGEPRHRDLCDALHRRGIEPVIARGALDEAIREERPNLVLLVGDASSDDGARGIDEARRAGPTPIVVATDPEPLDRRLAPFQYGASGIVVRRDDPDDMAGEIHHLLAENARRIAERARSGHTTSELDGLVGLGSRELRMSATPHEGLSRSGALALLRGRREGGAPGALLSPPPDAPAT